MHAISHHRPEHLPEGLGGLFRRLALTLFTGFRASWGSLMERNAARARTEDDDILWDDGEPERPVDRF
jgi:hypothetical protein